MESKLGKERSGDRKKLMARKRVAKSMDVCSKEAVGYCIRGTRSTELERGGTGKRDVNQYINRLMSGLCKEQIKSVRTPRFQEIWE